MDSTELKSKTVRAQILDEAKKCVCGDREEDYGSPESNFATIADLWTAYKGIKFSSLDVAMMMALLKIARIKAGTKSDSFIDLAGYAACAGEIVDAFESEKEGVCPVQGTTWEKFWL